MRSHGLHVPPSVTFQNLSSLGFEPLGITEQGQHPPETSGRWRPLEAKGCVTRPLAVEALPRFSEDVAEGLLVPFLKPLLISPGRLHRDKGRRVNVRARARAPYRCQPYSPLRPPKVSPPHPHHQNDSFPSGPCTPLSNLIN